jgi:hypothetical protein
MIREGGRLEDPCGNLAVREAADGSFASRPVVPEWDAGARLQPGKILPRREERKRFYLWKN